MTLADPPRRTRLCAGADRAEHDSGGEPNAWAGSVDSAKGMLIFAVRFEAAGLNPQLTVPAHSHHGPSDGQFAGHLMVTIEPPLFHPAAAFKRATHSPTRAAISGRGPANSSGLSVQAPG
jgi:hypothetical protein